MRTCRACLRQAPGDRAPDRRRPRRQADALPADEHRQEAAPEDQNQHEEAEEVQVAEEARVSAARLVVHVGDRIDVNEEPDAGDDQDHHRVQRVQPEGPRYLKRTDTVRRRQRDGRNPVTEGDDVITPFRGKASSCQKATIDRPSAAAMAAHATKAGRGAAEQPDANQAVHRGAQPRQNGYQPDQIHRVLIPTTA